MNIPLLIVILYVLLLFGISIYVSYSQKKDSENFLLYKGKNNAFVVAASIAGLAIGGASTIGIAENAFTVGLSAGWYDTAWAIGAVVSSMLAVRYLRRSQYTTISGLVRDLYGTKTSFIMVYHPVRHHRPAVQGGRLDSGIASAGCRGIGGTANDPDEHSSGTWRHHAVRSVGG